MPSLSRLIGRFLGLWPFGSAAQTARTTPHPPQLPRPNTPVCIIGDVHGMADLLENLLAQIALQPCAHQPRLIFVGDLIDRGPDSAAVLARVMGLCRHDPAHHICLMGNHERMLLDALAGSMADEMTTPPLTPDQITGFVRWLGVGGAETCDSFGVPSQMYRRPKGAPSRDDHILQTAQALRTAMGPTLLTWLQALPLYWQEADLAVCHAGADPRLPMADQDPGTLIWGPSAKRRAKTSAKKTDQPGLDQRWVVHGHVIVPQVDLGGDLGGTGNSAPRHIDVDTGAYRTGRLSALWLDQNGARVIEAAAR